MQPQPLVLTDDELSHIVQAAMPIALDRRDAFLEQVADLLRGCTGPIGPGTVHRAIEQAQRLYFDPPENDRTPSRARWDRDEPKSERVSSRLRAECLIPGRATNSSARRCVRGLPPRSRTCRILSDAPRTPNKSHFHRGCLLPALGVAVL